MIHLSNLALQRFHERIRHSCRSLVIINMSFCLFFQPPTHQVSTHPEGESTAPLNIKSQIDAGPLLVNTGTALAHYYHVVSQTFLAIINQSYTSNLQCITTKRTPLCLTPHNYTQDCTHQVVDFTFLQFLPKSKIAHLIETTSCCFHSCGYVLNTSPNPLP